MQIPLLLSLLLSQQVLSTGLIKVKDSRYFVTDLVKLDSLGSAYLYDYINPDNTDSVDNFGEFSIWSNAFLTVKPGQRVKLPKETDLSFITTLNTVGDTYLVLANVYLANSSFSLEAIKSLEHVYLCFRAYTSGNELFGEYTLRRPDRATVTDQIVETTYFGKSKKLSRNTHGAYVTSWRYFQGSTFSIYNGTERKLEFLPSKILAKTACFLKEEKGDIYVRHDINGFTYTSKKSAYI